MGRVADKIAVVTGVASPVGAACAERLYEEGASLMIADLDDDERRKEIERLARKGDNVRFIRHDASSEDDWRKVVEGTLEAFGRIDILVNTAQEFFLKPFLEMSLEELRGVSRTNIQSTWLGLKYVIPVMRQSGGGYIVNVTSVLGSVALADAAAYCAAASGVRMMTKSAALECGAGEYNILVNSVQAGAVDWPVRNDSAGGAAAARVSGLSGPPIDPTDVAAAVLHLATPDAKYVTGTELVIDGGYTAS